MHTVNCPHGHYDIDVCIDHAVEAGAGESTDTGHGSIKMISTTKRAMSYPDIAVSRKRHVHGLILNIKILYMYIMYGCAVRRAPS